MAGLDPAMTGGPWTRGSSPRVTERSDLKRFSCRALSSALAGAAPTAHIAVMTTFVTILLVLAMIGTLTVLGFGVASMLRGGDPRRSNKLMQSRVVMQALALVLLAMLMLLARH